MSNKIPKVIHYCWFGGNPLPPLALKCIESWKRYLPDYEIVQWDESNFDVNAIKYTSQAYEAKKYAFVSDYARFKILYEHGGIYFDTDVEVIKNMDQIIAAGPFMGREKPRVPGTLLVAAGLGLGATVGMSFYREVLNHYENIEFLNPDGTQNQITVVQHVTSLLVKKGLKYAPEIQEVAGMKIYPDPYFCPLNYYTKKMEITPESVSIHWYDASWMSGYRKFVFRICSMFGRRRFQPLVKLKRAIFK
ncbi:MAG: glycosyltransferase [Muribaculaceae bacterium]|nr:glycosyltransferase [Muribaculaceae bacterium]